MSHEKRTAPEGLGKDGMALAGVLMTSGVMHFVRPDTFQTMVPNSIPARRLLVYISGGLEIACGLGLLHSRTRRAAGFASAALLVAVLPANVTTASQAKSRLDSDPHSTQKRGYLAAAVVRLPLQWPMIRIALRTAGVLR